MIILVLLIISNLVLGIITIRLNIVFAKEKKIFEERVNILENDVSQIRIKQKLQSSQLKISSEFDENFKKNKVLLGSAVLNLNQELFEILSKNNLLEKE